MDTESKEKDAKSKAIEAQGGRDHRLALPAIGRLMPILDGVEKATTLASDMIENQTCILRMNLTTHRFHVYTQNGVLIRRISYAK